MLIPPTLVELAARQHALFTRAQFHGVGLPPSTLRAWARSGFVDPLGLHVFRIAGTPSTFDQACMAAALDCEGTAAVSGAAALALWRAPGPATPPVTLLALRDRQRRRTPLARVHESRALVVEHATRLRGVPVLVPTRLIFDVAYDVHPQRLEAIANYFGRHGWTSGPLLAAMAGELRRRGRAGSAAMGDLLRSLGTDWVPADSNLELRFERIVVDAGFPRPRRQVVLGDEYRWIRKVDFMDPELPVVGEVQGDAFHTAPLDAAADARRRAALEWQGFVVVDFAETEVWHDPRAVVDRWAAARRQARRDVPSRRTAPPLRTGGNLVL